MEPSFMQERSGHLYDAQARPALPQLPDSTSAYLDHLSETAREDLRIKRTSLLIKLRVMAQWPLTSRDVRPACLGG